MAIFTAKAFSMKMPEALQRLSCDSREGLLLSCAVAEMLQVTPQIIHLSVVPMAYQKKEKRKVHEKSKRSSG